MVIRSAKHNEAQNLTSISFASKGYWRYPQKYFETWNKELTISLDYIEKNDVFVAEVNGDIAGYYSIVELREDIEVSGINIGKGFWLDHMFILPQFLRQKIGTKMVLHLINFCRKNCIAQLSVLADPNSKGFYEKMGFKYHKEYPSTIPGRTTPLLSIHI